MPDKKTTPRMAGWREIALVPINTVDPLPLTWLKKDIPRPSSLTGSYRLSPRIPIGNTRKDESRENRSCMTGE